MSYCRFMEGDAYVLRLVDVEGIVCMACRLLPHKGGWYGDKRCKTPRGMIQHLQAHIRRGHRIPKHAIKRLEQEAA